MKKILYILIAAIFTACEGLDCEPHQALSPDVAYKGFENCDNAARGLYIRATSVYGSNYLLWADAFCDNLISFSEGLGHYSEFRGWTIQSGNTCLWSGPYTCIANCNMLLDKMAIPEDEAEAPKFLQLKAEALAWRGIMHFELVKQIGKSYVTASDKDLGVPYVYDTDPSNKPPRGTVKSNFDNILKDLHDAYELKDSSFDTENTRLSKKSIAGYLARVYLYMQNYVEAEKYAKLAVAGESICSLENFKNVWLDESQDGVLLNLNISQKDNLLVGDYFNQYLEGEYRSNFVIPKSFVDLMDVQNDIRYQAYVSRSNYKNFEAFHVIKYVGLADDNHIRNKVSLKVMRVAEMKLTIAEAGLRKESKDEEQANRILEELQINRVANTVYIEKSGADLLNEVMKQRRIELFGEWDRLTTIKRLALPIQRVPGQGDLADGTGRPYLETNLPADDYRFQFPIPSAEFDANPQMVQNPGY